MGHWWALALRILAALGRGLLFRRGMGQKALTHAVLGSREGAGDRCPVGGCSWGRASRGGGSPAGAHLALTRVRLQPSAACTSLALASFMLTGRI